MKHGSMIWLIVLLAGVQSAGAAQQQATWQTLFDGTSMSQWRGYGQSRMPDGWRIENGAMCACKPVRGMDIVSRESYENFVLELEFKIDQGSNSGIMWHVDESAGGYPWLTGPEYQLLDDRGADGAEAVHLTGANYDVQPPRADVFSGAGDWQTVRIEVNGAAVTHWLNGAKILAYEKGSDAWQSRVAGSKWAAVDTYGTTDSGHLALQGDHGVVWFRNIRIKRLP